MQFAGKPHEIWQVSQECGIWNVKLIELVIGDIAKFHFAQREVWLEGGECNLFPKVTPCDSERSTSPTPDPVVPNSPRSSLHTCYTSHQLKTGCSEKEKQILLNHSYQKHVRNILTHAYRYAVRFKKNNPDITIFAIYWRNNTHLA